jgi:hypothetical protein
MRSRALRSLARTALRAVAKTVVAAPG